MQNIALYDLWSVCEVYKYYWVIFHYYIGIQVKSAE